MGRGRLLKAGMSAAIKDETALVHMSIDADIDNRIWLRNSEHRKSYIKKKEVMKVFYYCAKCANIENIKEPTVNGQFCSICGNEVEPVPSDYLMSNGMYFKSQACREEFISKVKASDIYDETIGSMKNEIKQQKATEQQQSIDEMNQRMRESQFKMTCPICGSNSIQKISTVGKYAKVYAFGLLGADSLGKRWKCNVCGTKF